MTDTNATPKPRFAISKTILILSGVVVLATAGLVIFTINTVNLNATLAKTNAQVDELKADADRITSNLRTMTESRDSYKKSVESVAALEIAVAAKEKAVAARESAISAKEAHIQETTLKDGMVYTVGTSMQAGTYQTTSTSSRCYWKITRSGTNYGDIVDNDYGSVGVLSISVSGGQDFQSSSCGAWTKIG